MGELLTVGTHVSVRMGNERKSVHEGRVVYANDTVVAVKYGKRVIIVPWTSIEQVNVLEDVNETTNEG